MNGNVSSQGGDRGAVEAARLAEVEVFQTGGLAHAGAVQTRGQGGVDHGDMLGIDQDRESLFE